LTAFEKRRIGFFFVADKRFQRGVAAKKKKAPPPRSFGMPPCLTCGLPDEGKRGEKGSLNRFRPVGKGE